MVYEGSLETPIIIQWVKSFSAFIKPGIHYRINKIPTLKISVKVSEAQNLLPRFFSYRHTLLRHYFLNVLSLSGFPSNFFIIIIFYFHKA